MYMKNNNKTSAKILLTILLTGGGMLNAWSQTIFSNPVGLGVGSISGSNFLDVDGPIRFRTLSLGSGTYTLISDASGNLGFSLTNHLPAATTYGRFLMTDNSTPNVWSESDVFRASGALAPKIVIGDLKTPLTPGTERIELYGGGISIMPDNGVGISSASRSLHSGLTTYTNTSTSSPLLGHYAYMHSNNYGGFFGMNEDNTMVAFDDGTNGSRPNRLVFSMITRSGFTSSTANVTEFMTLRSSGNFGVGTSDPHNRIHLHNINNVNVYNQYTNLQSGNTAGDGFIVGINNIGNTQGVIMHREEDIVLFGTMNTHYMTLNVNGRFDIFRKSTNAFSPTTLFNVSDNDNHNAVYQNMTNLATSHNDNDGFRLGIDDDENAILNQQEDKDMIFYTNGSSVTPTSSNINERLRIKNDGKIGVNLNAPLNLFDVKGNAVFGLTYAGVHTAPFSGLLVEGTVGIGSPAPNGNNKLEVSGGTIIGLTYIGNTAPTNGLAVQGKVGIGTTTPVNELDVEGSAVIGALFSGSQTAPVNGLLVQGNVSIGITSTSAPNKLTVDGGTAIGSGYAGTLAPTNGLIVEGQVGIGTSSPSGSYIFEVSSGDANFNGDVYSAGTFQFSDSRFKKNILQVTNSINKIKLLNGYYYDYDYEKFPNKHFSKQRNLGLLAQNVKDVVPEAVRQIEGDYYAVQYTALIPLLIEGFKEQQLLIEQQNSRIAELEEQIRINISQQIKQTKSDQQIVLNDTPKLLQNEPNPFNNSTVIKYYLPANTVGAIIKIADIHGRLINTYTLKNTGYSELEVLTGNVAQGTFTYTLEINGKVIESKKMLLIND